MKKKVKKAKNVRCGVANVKKLRYLCIVFKVKNDELHKFSKFGGEEKERESVIIYIYKLN